MRHRLVLGVGLGVPFGALALVMVVTGAYIGTTFIQISTYHVPCRTEVPHLPVLGQPCATGLVPLLAAAPALFALACYAGLIRRWILGRRPRAGWSGMWVVGRVIIGGYVGLCAMAGGTWLYVILNGRLLHIGCTPRPRGVWMCEGNIYYGINPLVALLTIGILALYPILWVMAEDRS